MKKKLTLLIAALLGALSVSAQNGRSEGEDLWLVLWQKSGEVATYHVNTHPRIKYSDGDFLIVSDEVEIAYPEADVRKFTLAKDISAIEDGIIGVPEDARRDFSLNRARPGSAINIYDMSGRKVGSHTVGADGSLQYSLDSYPAGIYLIKTETTTIKIIKK